MQEDSMSLSTSGPITQSQVITKESPVKSLQCSCCALLFKSKVYLFEHLNKVHDFDVDAALREAGLKCTGTFRANTDNHSNNADDYECKHCNFKACGPDDLSIHEKQCQKKSEDQSVLGKIITAENPDNNTPVISTEQHSEAAGAKEIPIVISVTPTSKTKCTPNSSKDLKTYKRPLQTITKYFVASSGSNSKPPVKLADSQKLLDSTKGTLFLQESPSSSHPNSSGVFKVTAKSMIDITSVSHKFLLNDHILNTDSRTPKPKELFRETVSDNGGKRTNTESSNGPPVKKAKSDKEETKLPEMTNESKQQLSSSNSQFAFEVSEDEGEKKLHLVNGDMESSKVYFCKHCDYSDLGIRRVSTHYEHDHPYIRYNAAYIQDPNDVSATFRCLHCPIEFIGVAGVKRHYAENHPEAPNIFTKQSSELHLVYKCFVCQFTTNVLKALENHYKENHPKHKMDNALMYCRYMTTGSQEGSERQIEISAESGCTPRKDVKNAPLAQHPTSTGADASLYHCNSCKFSHKSVVVMHVHYQKSHPGEAVTIDKIKQSVCVTSHTASQMTPHKSLNSVTITEKSALESKISDSSKKTKDKAELSKHTCTSEASETHSEFPKTKKAESAEDRNEGTKPPTKHSRETPVGKYSISSSSPDKLFYCQFCSYSSTNIRSVIGHHNAKHSLHALTGTEEILLYSAKVQKKKLQREAKALANSTSSASQTSNKVEVSSEKGHEEDEAADSSLKELNAYARPECLFYCQKCNFANPSAKGVANHQNKVHPGLHSSKESIIAHTALVHDEIEKSKSQVKELSFSTRLPLPLMNKGDDNKFFCHFCNYRHGSLELVMKHYIKKHRGFGVTVEQVHLYTSIVLEKTQKCWEKTANQEANHTPRERKEKKKKKKKTKKLGKSLFVSAPPSVTASETQRTLKCSRCSYSTQHVYLLRRHLWKVHEESHSVADVLRICFKQGSLQTGYHCDMCVFSHKKAAAVYKHYQEQHQGRTPSLDYVNTRLYVGPEIHLPKKKKPKIKQNDDNSGSDGTDGSLLSKRPGQIEIKTYSCRACSFKGSSRSGLTRHYRAVHPWSVKEDGSVLDVVTSKRSTANRQLEEYSDIPGSFESYQVPLDFESLDSPPEETASSTYIWCPYCPASFNSLRGLSTHCGMKHREAVTENSDKPQEHIGSRMHVFKCPHCTYVNTSYQGVLTHCQMKHPDLASRADSHFVDKGKSYYWGSCVKSKGSGVTLRLRGYMCKTCPKMCATIEKLNRHSKREHFTTVGKTVRSTVKAEPEPSAVSKITQFKTQSNRGSVPQASFLKKKIYAVVKCQLCTYQCSTKIGLDRHVRVHHKNAPDSMVKDCVYTCSLCPASYFTKIRLGSHYIKKHGRDSFLKHYAPVYKQAHEKPAPASPDPPSTQHPENTHGACESSTTTDANKKLVFRCPRCPYVNASYHGTLTHCQMRHPEVIARADELQTQEILVANMVRCSIGKGSNERGYMCKICPLIYASMKKLKIHYERDHNQAYVSASEHSADHETEKQPDQDSQGSALEAVSSTETSISHQMGASETHQSNTLSVQNKTTVYKCHLCIYKGFFRRYLHSHYKKSHKLDPPTIHNLLEKYNKRRIRKLTEAESKESDMKCKKCPELTFNSSQLLVAHYSTFHSSDCILDFTVISQGKKKGSTGLYRCIHCSKQMNGIRKLWYHLDCHRERAKAAKTTASLDTTTPEPKSIEFKQDEVLTVETVQDSGQRNVPPAETFTFPPSPLPSPSAPTDREQPELEPSRENHTCKQCKRTFMSLKGLRSHERSHAAMAAIKKTRDILPTSAKGRNIKNFVIFKSGTLKPFLCSLCSYRTTVMGLWRSHFMKSHKDEITDYAETDQQDESIQTADEESYHSSEESTNWTELDEEPEITENSLYSEPPNVQRQLSHYNLMAQADATSKTNGQDSKFPDDILLHCEFCNFNTEHLSSIRRHYLNRHGKKFLKCKDCEFFTASRKTLEMHIERGHSTCQSEPTHHKDLRCPFCLYQTKNKNNLIDHIVLHREERVVPIEVRRSKLSRYLRGIVFRCHKCTFTCGSDENLRLHMRKHDDIKPYKCRLCYFDCTQLSDLEAHLSDKHQVVRNHELVGQVSLDQLQAKVDKMPEEEEEPSSNLGHQNNDSEDAETEDSVTDCYEVHETQTKNLVENSTREKITLQTEEECQEQELEGKDEESPARSSVLDLQFHDAKPNTDVQENREQDPQEQAVVFSPAEPKRRGSEDGSTTFTEQEEETTEKSQVHKMHNKVLQQRTLDIEAKVEDNILRHILLLDEDGSISKTHKKDDRTVRTEKNIKTEVGDNVQNEMMLLDAKGSIPLAHKPKNQTNTEAISALEKKNQVQANNRMAQLSVTVQRPLLSPPLKCAELKISHEESFSVTNCKMEQDQYSEEVRDPYGEMPVLENEYLKEEMQPLDRCKEDENDPVEQNQDKEDEVITEDDENRYTNQKHEESDEIKEVDNPHVPKGTLTVTVTDGAAEVLCEAPAEEKPFTCELCGRSLLNSFELKRHIMRHGI
ncbi:zinc finger protein 462-like [Plectropomus leopardus]|uniref:zinc finger protein 462-like n=1 Tax=Plectropomus leopardus TaxID=160734 RepID=UPI001C4A867B|nr:zinc finger protein 462-like [Plectropomus leopardus]